MSSTTTSATRLVALVGNPNAGKTSLFNALTGSYQKVGNYPGVTVEKVEGQIYLDSETISCTDIPGLYSMSPTSEDERVAVEAIRGSDKISRPDLLVYVLDATNLERNLYLFTQLAEENFPVVIALTMTDRLQRDRLEIDIAKFSTLVGVDIIPVVGHKDKGIPELKAAIERNLEAPRVPDCELGLPDELEEKVAALSERLARAALDFALPDVRRLLLHPPDNFTKFIEDTPELKEVYEDARQSLQHEIKTKPGKEVANRYRWAEMVQKEVFHSNENVKTWSITDRIDTILTHRFFGLVVFLGIMYVVFQSIYTFAGPLMDAIDGAFGWLQGVVNPWLEGTPWVQSLVVDGLIAGVGGMLVFLPQILILFFFIAVLEGTGYLARAAFLMDRLLGWCGLNGRAFIPLLSSFACAIPGIMSARVMPDPKSRLATILVAPLMSCSARLPVYILLIGAFIEPQFGPVWAGVTLFGMHLLGLFVAIPVVWFINRKVVKGKHLPFFLELPSYQWPKWRDVWLAMYFRGKIFVKTAGTIIVAMAVVIWALSYFPRSTATVERLETEYAQMHSGDVNEGAMAAYVDQELLAQSFLGRFGKSIEPVFMPAGFDWRITTAILSAFPAREVVVPAMGIMFSLGGDVDEESPDLRSALAHSTWPDGRPLVTPWTAVGLMVFFALCCQCMATLATVKRETNSWKWPIVMFTYMTALAYIAAVAINQIGLVLG